MSVVVKKGEVIFFFSCAVILLFFGFGLSDLLHSNKTYGKRGEKEGKERKKRKKDCSAGAWPVRKMTKNFLGGFENERKRKRKKKKERNFFHLLSARPFVRSFVRPSVFLFVFCLISFSLLIASGFNFGRRRETFASITTPEREMSLITRVREKEKERERERKRERN